MCGGFLKKNQEKKDKLTSFSCNQKMEGSKYDIILGKTFITVDKENNQQAIFYLGQRDKH